MKRILALLLALAGVRSEAIAQTPSAPPQVWGIVIGIDDYEDPAIPDCRGASSDARSLKRWLVETAGWPSSNILVMDGLAPRGHGPKEQQIEALRPTRENLDWAVREWLTYRMKPGDLILISFGGQSIGGRVGDPKSRDQLLPIDTNSLRIDSTGWLIQDALDAVAAKGDNPVLVWLDTSLSGRGKPAADLTGRRTLADTFLMEITRWPGVTAWLAAEEVASINARQFGQPGAMLSAILPAMGTAERPGNLLGAIMAANRNPQLVSQHFRTAGGLGPEWSLWPKSLAAIVRPPGELLLQHGHSDRITAIVFSPDGSTMITASRDSTIKVWRANDRVLLRTLSSHTVGVTDLALSSDGSKLASGDGAGRVVVWSMSSFRPSRFLGVRPHERAIAKLAFRGDGDVVASLDEGGKAVAWSLTPEALNPKILTEDATAIAAGDDVIAVARRERLDQPSIQIFEKNGTARGFPGPSGLILARSLAIEGNRLAVGNKTGDFSVWNLNNGNLLGRVRCPDPITCVTLTSSSAFCGSGRSIVSISTDVSAPARTMATTEPVSDLSVDAREKILTARSPAGQIQSWDLSDLAHPEPLSPQVEKGDAPTSLVVISPQGDWVSGDQDGGVRVWEKPDGPPTGRIRPHRSKIETLALAHDGRYLAQIDHDRQARVWDLREGRDLLTIPGQWNSLAFLPDGLSLVMSRHDGSVVLVDRISTGVKPNRFEVPLDASGKPSSWGFATVAVSPDGSMIAAGSPHGPLAAVWHAEGGTPIRAFRDHDDPITRVRFSDDSRRLLTASLDGTARIWRLDIKEPPVILRVERGAAPDDDTGVTAAVFSPGEVRQVATGHRDGRVILWRITGGEARPSEMGRFEGPVKDLEITPDGTRLIACGEDRTVRSWRLDGDIPPLKVDRFLPEHTEQVNALVVWPDGKLVASASDDSSIRLWKPDDRRLVGTVCVTPTEGSWVAFTPDGQFDSAPGGETDVTYIEENRVKSLDQADDKSRVFGLAAKWINGEAIPGRSALLVSRPPPLWLAPRGEPEDGEVELNLRMTEANLGSFRLYVNDKPVRDETDFRATDDPSLKVVSVRLGAGSNRIVAMASRPVEGAIYGRSNEVVLTGPMREEHQGVVHSLALGISKYRQNPLQYADKDATEMAAFLARNGVGGGGRQGMKLVLKNDEVDALSVEKAMTLLRDHVQPEDTVVVFLAGHTDVRRDRFYLLLPKFPFEKETPRDQPIAVRDDPATLMPYAAIYGNLARMNAQKRLVIIDACQADAVLDDPGVRRIQDKVDDGAHRARTSYLLTTRRGEAAESTTLEHGLITHLLLRGMGSQTVKDEPGGKLGNADANDDLVVSTEELRQFLETNLPRLSSQVELTGLRANPNAPPRSLEQSARAQNATLPFPLVRLPR